MSTLTSYNQLQVVTPDPTGAGGLAINDNFKMLSTKMATSNPGATDDSDSNYAEGSIWYNTSTNTAFICVNATVGAAVWNALPYSSPTFSIGGISTGQGIVWNGTEFVPLDTTAAAFVLAPHDSKPFTFSTDGSGNGQISCNSLSLGGATFNANDGGGSGGGSWNLDGGTLNLDSNSYIHADGSGNTTFQAGGSGYYTFIGNGILYDSSNTSAVDWGNRQLNQNNGGTSVDWQNQVLEGEGIWTINWDSYSSQFADGSGNVTLNCSSFNINSNDIILGGSLTTSGAHSLTLTTTGTTNITLPTSGTLLTKSGGTLTGALDVSVNGAASTPAVDILGSWYTGGTATSTTPQVLIQPTGTTSTGWQTTGTGLGINCASGFSGYLTDWQVNGSSKAHVDTNGNIFCNGYVNCAGGMWSNYADQIGYNGSNTLRNNIGGASSLMQVFNSNGSNITFTSGQMVGLNVQATNNGYSAFAPSSGTSTLVNILSQCTYGATGGTGSYSSIQVNDNVNNTAATYYGLSVKAIYDQASGSGAATDILVNRTETATGSGNQRLIDLQIGGISQVYVDHKTNTVLNGTGSALSTSATNGFLYIPNCAGAPSGTPTSITGASPIVFDTTDNKIWIYTGGAWKGVVVS